MALLAMPVKMPDLEVSSPAFICGYSSMRRWAELPVDQVPSEARTDVAKFKVLIERAGDGRPLGPVMSLIDGLAATCRRANDFKEAAEKLPEGWKRGPIDRAWMLEVAGVLSQAESNWKDPTEEKLTGGRRKTILDSKALPKAWDWLADKLGFEGVQKSLRIFVVPRFAAPGGITLQTSNGVAIIVSAEVFDGTALLETVLHEAIHACETEATKVDLLSRIRSSEALQKLDLADRRNLPHTVYFIAAAEAIRQGGAKDHKDVGITLGTYERAYEKYRRHIEPLWKDYLAGKVDRKKLAEMICAYDPTSEEGS